MAFDLSIFLAAASGNGRRQANRRFAFCTEGCANARFGTHTLALAVLALNILCGEQVDLVLGGQGHILSKWTVAARM